MRSFDIIVAGVIPDTTNKQEHWSSILTTNPNILRLGIGYNNKLPWNIPSEMQHFKSLTSIATSKNKTNVVIMGKNTWYSIPSKYRPLSGRYNIVVSGTFNKEMNDVDELNDNLFICQSLNEALTHCLKERFGKIFVIGGEMLYNTAVEHPMLNNIHLSIINPETEANEADEDTEEKKTYKFNKYFNLDNTDNFYLKHTEKHTGWTYNLFIKKNTDEHKYLGLIGDILKNGSVRDDRTGTGTISTFGNMVKYSLENGRLPLLTTKRTYWKGIVHELLWFISGSTNSKELEANGVNIWKGNSSKEFLETRGLGHLEEGDCGQIYGFQWRHFGAKYTKYDANYDNEGFDQLEFVINEIKNNPNSRRIILNAWNAKDIDKMALPPCHVMAQFYVNNGKLSCLMTQRSCDIGLGVPFNIASYALLTHMIAYLCDLEAYELIHSMGDTHIYKNHTHALDEQLTRLPYQFPTVSFVGIDYNKIDKIDDFKFENIKLWDYECYKSINMEMAV
jgi:dihydrofolate reductase/thymidylate synthase